MIVAQFECLAQMPNYNPTTATVEEARNYADCVRLVYGDSEPLSSGMILILKGLIVLSLVVAGVWGTQEYRSEGAVGGIIMGMVGAFIVWVAALLLALVLAGIAFVVGG